jgi:carboxypeptidase T
MSLPFQERDIVMKYAISAVALALATLMLPARADVAEGTRERAQERQRTNLFKAWFPDVATARKAAVSLHDALLETEYERGWQIFELDAEQQALLQRFGYRLEPAREFIARRDAYLKAIDEASARAGREVPLQEAIPGFACYETVEETFALASGMALTKPQLATWTEIGSSWQKTAGSGGYPMYVLKLTNSATSGVGGTKPKLFIHSAMHAREYVTAPAALAFARWLYNGHGTDPEATWLLDHHEIHLLLQTNPDGRKKAETGLLWRKNTNTAYCGRRSNNRGADLNRNFQFGWNSTNGQGSSGLECSETYRGPSAASEPETQAVQNYIRSLWPDRRGPSPTDPAPEDTSGIHLDLHSAAGLLLWPWGTTTNPAPNGSALQTLGRRLAWFNGYFPEQSIGLYPTDGTSDGPSYGELGVAQFTFEMGTTFFQPCADFENTIKPDNLKALIYAAKVVRAPYVTPSGPEAAQLTLAANGVPAGTPVGLTAAITDTRFSNDNGVEPVQAVASATAYVDVPPWAPGAVPLALTPADGAFNAPTESAAGTLGTAGLANGRHLVWVVATDAAGKTGPATAAFLDIGTVTPPAVPITFGIYTTSVNRRTWAVDTAWSGVTGTNVDLYVNGGLLATTANDGAYRDQRGRGTWRYKVCQTGSTSACSPERTVTF